jgi:inorganic pyrophosphatase
VVHPTSIAEPSGRDGVTSSDPDALLVARGGDGASAVALTAERVTPMLEYELYVPLHHNDGSPIDPQKLKDLKRRLVDEFGGLTHLLQENEGFWKIGEHTFRDRIEILRVLANADERVQQYFALLKEDLKREWGQQHFLIVSRQVTAV